jgi:hypothetical protein
VRAAEGDQAMAWGKDEFWRYVRVQLFVLLCGIVGPMFLFVYFAVQPEPGLKWMYYIGLVITAADVLIAIGIANSADGVDKLRKKSR